MAKTAIITGVLGQDGFFLAETLLLKGYRVIGTTRHSLKEAEGPLLLPPGVEVIEYAARTLDEAREIVARYRPNEIYNLAARASSGQLHEDPLLTADANGLAVVRLLEAIRLEHPSARLCQASSSEVFGNPDVAPQSEATPVRPRNSYGAAKLYAQNMVEIYRKKYGFFATSAILYNHESHRRDPHFLSKKVCRAAAEISLGMAEFLTLGDLEARRDWGYAGDYVECMWLMLQQNEAQDFVVASGTSHSVKDLCDVAFQYVGLEGRNFIRVDKHLLRGNEPVELRGDPTRAETKLGWRRRVGFASMIRMMVDFEVAELRAAVKP
ncbi:MAG: GDP-mannose 4,6-dehydratase [Acetobacteraceae bacterium]|jgi:GDPmannose 4,6-dehydratase